MKKSEVTSEFGASVGKVVVGESNFVSFEKFAGTLVVSRNFCVGKNVVEQMVNNASGTGVGIKVVALNLEGMEVNVRADEVACSKQQALKALNELIRYAKNIKTFLKFNKCKNFTEYKKKYKKPDGCRVVVVISELLSLTSGEMGAEIKERIVALLKVGQMIGINIIANVNAKNLEKLGEQFALSFENRLLFNNLSNSLVRELSWGMYNSTSFLSDFEFYYLTPDKGNGSLLEIS